MFVFVCLCVTQSDDKLTLTIQQQSDCRRLMLYIIRYGIVMIATRASPNIWYIITKGRVVGKEKLY